MATKISRPLFWAATIIAVLALVPLFIMTTMVAAVAWMPIVAALVITAVIMLVRSRTTIT